MQLDSHDTIVAIGTPSRPAARGMVRLSGPEALGCLSHCFEADAASSDWRTRNRASVVSGKIRSGQEIPCQLLLWPTEKSYTRQPSAEIHTFGSTPILEQIVELLCEHGARLAEPGEFTLRAFLAGRLDLTQAEGVLGVIDSEGPEQLDASLEQLAGGLSKPLQATRQQLIELLAELEAGLDFVEEDIEFISSEQLCSNLQDARSTVEEIRNQLSTRTVSEQLPRVVLVGPPNAGKSSLFNVLSKRWGSENTAADAIVSQQAGTTRDYVTASISVGGIDFLLVDTAGEDDSTARDSIDQFAQSMAEGQKGSADLRIHCRDLSSQQDGASKPSNDVDLFVGTKSDLQKATDYSGFPCSAHTGEGIERLKTEILNRLSNSLAGFAGITRSTTLRCSDSLEKAYQALARALELAEHSGGEELVAAEVRTALTEIGRVVGTVYTDDILDQIFGQFCIGK